MYSGSQFCLHHLWLDRIKGPVPKNRLRLPRENKRMEGRGDVPCAHRLFGVFQEVFSCDYFDFNLLSLLLDQYLL